MPASLLFEWIGIISQRKLILPDQLGGLQRIPGYGEQIDAFRRRLGHDPASIHLDTIYRIRENCRYCDSRGIRLSGPPLGRPWTITEANAEQI